MNTADGHTLTLLRSDSEEVEFLRLMYEHGARAKEAVVFLASNLDVPSFVENLNAWIGFSDWLLPEPKKKKENDKHQDNRIWDSQNIITAKIL